MDIDKNIITTCVKNAKIIRQDALKLTYGMGNVGAHIGGALSLAEIMSVLYSEVMNISAENLTSEDRDRLIFSKGHGTLALYSAMKCAGIITEEELLTYKKNETFLYAHPSMNQEKGIEFSSGSLGQGLSLGVGVCLGLKRKENIKSRVFVILGDGECDEGAVWEAAQSAAHFNCSQLVAIIDNNGLQYDGKTEDIMNNMSQVEKWNSFGWKANNVDGHNVEELIKALKTPTDKPLAIIANTIKGKGISYMENNPLWHNHSLTKEQYEQAVKEVE